MTYLPDKLRAVAAQAVGRFAWEHALRDDRDLSGRARLLGCLLATYADPDGSHVSPGVALLVAITGWSKRTVLALLDDLRDADRIERVSRADRYRGRADQYRLTVPGQVQPQHPDSAPTQVQPQHPDAPDRVLSAQRQGALSAETSAATAPPPDQLPDQRPGRDARARETAGGEPSPTPPPSETSTRRTPTRDVPDPGPEPARKCGLPSCSDPAPCRGCGDAKQRHKQWKADRDRYARSRAAVKASIPNCPDCRGEVWLEGPDGKPTGEKCQHSRLHEVMRDVA